MKQTIISLLLALLPLAASADAVEIDGIYYNLIPKGKVAEVTSNPNKYSGAVEIPDTVTYNDVIYKVTSIGSQAFWKCSGLTSVEIPNFVTSIGDYAFFRCSGLTSLTIPNSVTSIGADAFSSCNGLTSVTIPNSVTSIGGSVFSGCSGLTSLDIPNSVTSISNYAFSGCCGLTSVTIPNSVTTIGNEAFSGCSSLTSVTIPNSVRSIGAKAFSGCSDLTSVTIGTGMMEIYFGAFASCPKLTDVYCYSENESYIDPDVFADSYIEYATLYVHASSINGYKNRVPWNRFKDILPIEDITLEKCAKPSITYSDNEFTFSCETEGVEYVWQMTVADGGQGNSPKVGVTGKYKVSVYATKDGFENSDTATMEVDIRGKKGDVSGDGSVDATDITKLIDIILQKNTTINTEQ